MYHLLLVRWVWKYFGATECGGASDGGLHILGGATKIDYRVILPISIGWISNAISQVWRLWNRILADDLKRKPDSW